MLKRILIILLPLPLMLVLGCGKTPTTEMEAAETALQNAKTSEADQYAPEAYQMATDTLDAARAAIKEQDSKSALFRSYGKAKTLFISARNLAELAAKEAMTEKERVGQEVSGMMAEAQALIDSAAKAIAAAPQAKMARADVDKAKSDISAMKKNLDQARADFEATMYLTARDKLDSIKATAQSIINAVETARAKRAGR